MVIIERRAASASPACSDGKQAVVIEPAGEVKHL